MVEARKQTVLVTKCEVFIERVGFYAANDYKLFIDSNPQITVVSVLAMCNNTIVLTYQEEEEA